MDQAARLRTGQPNAYPGPYLGQANSGDLELFKVPLNQVWKAQYYSSRMTDFGPAAYLLPRLPTKPFGHQDNGARMKFDAHAKKDKITRSRLA